MKKRQLRIGTRIELEHARTIRSILGRRAKKWRIYKVAEMIARDHLREDPRYYYKLKKCRL